MVQVKTVLAVIAVVLAYYYYKSSSPKVEQRDSPVVKIVSGSLQGIIGQSREGREFYEYLGIPYAKPPVGALRFETPQPVDKWEGVREARNYGSMCMQVESFSKSIKGNEDCLFLNVHTPKLNTGDKLMPVMVWIHGGMFVFGSADMYRPGYFMDHDIVLVTMNYRLGSLGFLNAGDTNARGNQGLRDQNMALKWVQANIKSFGGDPKQVTIFGESAGGASVHHQVLSPLSKGLFQKAISQSGSALGNWATRTNPVEQSKKFSESLGCPTKNSKSMVECLRNLDAVKIQEASFDDILDGLRDPISIFNPSIEQVKDEQAFITEHPSETTRKGNFNKVPWLAGVTSQEGLLITTPFLRDSKFKEIYDNYDVNMPNLLWYTGPENKEGFQKVKDFYFGKGKIDPTNKFQDWTDIMTDNLFAEPTERAIRAQSKHAPVYAYYYSYKGEFSLANIFLAISGKYPPLLELMYFSIPRWFNKKFLGIEPPHFGACHFDEVALQFPLDRLGVNISPSDKDYQMSKKLVKSWVDFASSPVSEPLQFDGISWPKVNAKEGTPLKYMHIDTKSKLIDEPNSERNKFWKSVKLYNN